MCFSGPASLSTCIQCAIGLPYFFSMEGKYEAGPETFSCVAMLTSANVGVDLAKRLDSGREPRTAAATVATDRRHLSDEQLKLDSTSTCVLSGFQAAAASMVRLRGSRRYWDENRYKPARDLQPAWKPVPKTPASPSMEKAVLKTPVPVALHSPRAD